LKIILKPVFIIAIVSVAMIGVMVPSVFAQYDEGPVVILETTQGNITIEFFTEYAPEHVQNFVILSSTGYYDNTLFHRIIPGFMIQGGDPNTISGEPNTWGQGGPDEKLDAEFNNIKHNRGIVSMARSSDPNSAGSQFFIVHKDSTFLDGKYTVFGKLATAESFETLDKIAAVQTGTSDRPINPEQVRIIKASLVETDATQEKIAQLEAEQQAQQEKITQLEKSSKGGGCLIATATYGSEMATEVQLLRELRDNQLLQTESGTAFMSTFNDIYYTFSPIIADYERENPLFKEAVKLAITPLLSSLSILNYVDMDSEESVLGYGISLIILNLGMYLGVPAVVIVGIRKIK
jgi:cyclophilin family peptidyl-prolyl cis-trans isomerase